MTIDFADKLRSTRADGLLIDFTSIDGQQTGVYAALKTILQAGTNVRLTQSDDNNTIVIANTASADGGLTEIVFPAWVNSATYVTGQPVWHNGGVYVANQTVGPSNTGPDADTTNWISTSQYRGAFAAAAYYDAGQYVLDDDNEFYIARSARSPSATKPQDDATNWHALTGATGGLTQTQVDARVRAGVLDWARTGNTDTIPTDKLNIGTTFTDVTELPALSSFSDSDAGAIYLLTLDTESNQAGFYELRLHDEDYYEGVVGDSRLHPNINALAVRPTVNPQGSLYELGWYSGGVGYALNQSAFGSMAAAWSSTWLEVTHYRSGGGRIRNSDALSSSDRQATQTLERLIRNADGQWLYYTDSTPPAFWTNLQRGDTLRFRITSDSARTLPVAANDSLYWQQLHPTDPAVTARINALEAQAAANRDATAANTDLLQALDRHATPTLGTWAAPSEAQITAGWGIAVGRRQVDVVTPPDNGDFVTTLQTPGWGGTIMYLRVPADTADVNEIARIMSSWPFRAETERGGLSYPYSTFAWRQVTSGNFAVGNPNALYDYYAIANTDPDYNDIVAFSYFDLDTAQFDLQIASVARDFRLNPSVLERDGADNDDVLSYDATANEWRPRAETASGTATPLSDADPQAAGSAASGSANAASRADHVHPSELGNSVITHLMLNADNDAERLLMRNRIGAGTSSVNLSNADPRAPGPTAEEGTATTASRADHRHPRELADNVITSQMLDAGDATKQAAFRTRIGAGTGSGGASITVENDGTALATAAETLNFGSGLVASNESGAASQKNIALSIPDDVITPEMLQADTNIRREAFRDTLGISGTEISAGPLQLNPLIATHTGTSLSTVGVEINLLTSRPLSWFTGKQILVQVLSDNAGQPKFMSGIVQGEELRSTGLPFQLQGSGPLSIQAALLDASDNIITDDSTVATQIALEPTATINDVVIDIGLLEGAKGDAADIPESLVDAVEQNRRLLSDMSHTAGSVTWANAVDSTRDATVATNLGGLYFSRVALSNDQVRAIRNNRWSSHLEFNTSDRGYLYIRGRHNRDHRHGRIILDHVANTPDLTVILSTLNGFNSTDQTLTWRYFDFIDRDGQREIIDGSIGSVQLQFGTVANPDATEYRGKFGGTFESGVLIEEVADEAAWMALPDKTNKFYFEPVR